MDTGKAGPTAPDPTVGAAHPAAGSGGTHSRRGGDGGHAAHLPMAGCGDSGMAGVQPVPPRHLRAAAVPPGHPHNVRCMPPSSLHPVLELPGTLPLLQRHLRRARRGGAALRGHPQPGLPLPPGLLCTCWLLPGAHALPAWHRRGCPWWAPGPTVGSSGPGGQQGWWVVAWDVSHHGGQHPRCP